MTPLPSHQPFQAAVPTSVPDSGSGLAQVPATVFDLWNALLATGARPPEAFDMVAEVHGKDAARPLLQDALNQLRDGPHVRVEYDPDYEGGDYDGAGRFAYVPDEAVGWLELDEAFRLVTGLDPVHIIYWGSDERFTAHGEPLED